MPPLVHTPRHNLRDFTPARVALPTTGHSITTSESLSFQLACARARDVVHAGLHPPSFSHRLRTELPVLDEAAIPILELHSNAPDRAAYLRHPNLGRTLYPGSLAQLHPANAQLAIIIADGLSALAIERHAIPLLANLLPALLADTPAWTIAPLTVVEQGRVAISDAIGSALHAKISLILIGERPGLSSPDSMGAYITWSPHPTRTDADRNCISNIRESGLAPGAAAGRLLWYLQAARARQHTGIVLKEDSNASISLPTLPANPHHQSMDTNTKIAALNEILTMDPANAFARYGLAMEHLGQNNPDAALAEFSTCIDKNPDYVPAYQMSAQMLAKLGRNEEALDRLHHGISAANRTGNQHALAEMEALRGDLSI